MTDSTTDPVDTLITAAAEALALPIKPQWKPAIRSNLDITLKLARLVDEFPLPDDSEPAPVYRA